MSCDLEYFVVHSYFDGELSAIRAAEFKHHLADCSDCIDELAALSSIRGSLKYARLYEAAPALLRQKIRADLHSITPTTNRSLLLSWRGLAAAAGLFLVVLILWRVIPGVPKEEDYQAEFAAGIVDAHLRSLLPAQLTNVNSSDPQTVSTCSRARSNLFFRFAISRTTASRCRAGAWILFKVGWLPRSFIAAAISSSMSSFGTRANWTVHSVQVRGRAINGLIGGKASWSSALCPPLLHQIWTDSSGS